LKGRRTQLNYRRDPDVLKCRYFNKDFQVEIKEIGSKGLALLISRWLDLGSGLTPMDTKWRVHLARDKAAEVGKLGEAEDMRLRFKSESDLSQDSLSRQNAHT